MKVNVNPRDLSDKAREVWNATDPKELLFGDCRTLAEVETTALWFYDEMFKPEDEEECE